ncbi:MAG: rubrerythrin family protein [Eggerthellaceae bacterium]|nr:rubrerythrin family protein [Eggerthellaceae bacterium]
MGGKGSASEQVSRRGFVKRAAVGAAALSLTGILAACTDDSGEGESGEGGASDNVLAPTSAPSAETGNNFNIMPDSTTVVGTTYENLISAMTGETGATTKYSAYSKVADKEGFPQIARLFACAADAEKIHIELEYALALEIDPTTERPPAPQVETHESDINLIFGAQGEIYETSDMYPSFIKVAQEEGNEAAVEVFTRAKLAEAYHAERYMDAYNTIDTPTDEHYYLCPICGYIHKGEGVKACPICLTPKSRFTTY